MKKWLAKNWVWVTVGAVLVVGGAVGGCLASKEKKKKHHLTITTREMPEGEVGVGYGLTFEAAYGTKPYSWRDVNGTLATYGLNLNASTGVVTGTPTQATSASGVSVTIEVTDAYSRTAEKTFTLIIWPALQITTGYLAPATEGASYTLQLQATGGKNTSYQWSLASGSLPNGLDLSEDGTISGTPASGTSSGSPYSFTIELTDGIATVQASLWLEVYPSPNPIRIVTESLPPAEVKKDYSFTLQAEGGDGNYTWSMVAPSGSAFSLNSSTGELSGTPSNAGYEPLLVKVQDGSGNSHTRLLGVRVSAWTREVAQKGWAAIGGAVIYDSKRNCALGFLASLDGLKVFWMQGTTVVKEELLCSAFTLSVAAATTPDGTPAVAFSALHPTASGGFAIYYATYNGSAWTLETVASGKGMAHDISLAFDSKGTPYIAAYDDDHDFLRYYERSGGAWNVVEFDTAVTNRGEGVRIAIDSGGTLHFAYIRNGQTLRYASYDGSSWTYEDVAEAGDDVEDPSLLIYNREPHIGCTNSDKPQHVWFDGSGWNVEPISGGLFFVAMGVWLAVNSQGELYAAYCVMVPYMSIEVAHRVGYADWEVETAVDYFPVGGGALMAFDKDDNPVIGAGNAVGLAAVAAKTAGAWTHTYIDGPVAVAPSVVSPNNKTICLLTANWKEAKLTLHTYDGTSWTSTSVKEGVYVATTAITSDGDKNLHIAFIDWPTGTLYYGFSQDKGSTWSLEIVDLGVWTESPRVSIAVDSKNNPAIAYVDGDRVIYATKQTQVWNTEDPGFADTNGEGLALLFNSNDNPVLFYSANNGLACVWWDGSAWQNHIHDAGNECGAVAAKVNGNAGLVFYHINPTGLRFLKVDLANPGAGSPETVTGDAAEQIAASLDPSTGEPFASYFNQDTMSVSFAYPSSGAWSTTLIESGLFPAGMAMVCDSNSINHIFYSATGDLVHGEEPPP